MKEIQSEILTQNDFSKQQVKRKPSTRYSESLVKKNLDGRGSTCTRLPIRDQA